MRLTIRGNADYARESVYVADGISVDALREQLAALYDIADPRRIRMIHRGALLEDSHSLSHYSIEDGSALHVVVRPQSSSLPDGGVAGDHPVGGGSGSSNSGVDMGNGANNFVFSFSPNSADFAGAIRSAMSMAGHDVLNTLGGSEGAPQDWRGQLAATVASTVVSALGVPNEHRPNRPEGPPPPQQQQQASQQPPSAAATDRTTSANNTAEPLPSPMMSATSATPAPRGAFHFSGPTPISVTPIGMVSPLPMGPPPPIQVSSVFPPPLPPSVSPGAAVVHLHIHCSLEEMSQLPDRLSELSRRVPLNVVMTSGDPSPYPRPQSANPAPQDTAASNATTPTTTTTESQQQQPLRDPALINCPFTTALSTANFSIPALFSGDSGAVNSVREVLRMQLQHLLDEYGDVEQTYQCIARSEARHILEVVTTDPRNAEILSAGSRVQEITGHHFNRDMEACLTRLFVALAKHLNAVHAEAREWTVQLRALIARNIGADLQHASQWFSTGREALQTLFTNAAGIILQQIDHGRTPLLPLFLAFLGREVQSQMAGWIAEYERLRHTTDSPSPPAAAAATTSATPTRTAAAAALDTDAYTDLLDELLMEQEHDDAAPTATSVPTTTSSASAGTGVEENDGKPQSASTAPAADALSALRVSSASVTHEIESMAAEYNQEKQQSSGLSSAPPVEEKSSGDSWVNLNIDPFA